MKKSLIFLLLLFFLFGKNSNAQCEVDAGDNVHLCVDIVSAIVDSVRLNPKVISGIPPYDFHWEANHPVWGNLNVGNILDDTMAINPLVTSNFGFRNEVVELTLHLTDSIGNTCEDSLFISESSFAMLLVDIKEVLVQGDSVEFGWFRIGNGIPPLSVAWSPNYNISDTTITNPTLWPDTSLIYEMFITDSVGCILKDYLPVCVNTSSVDDFFDDDYQSKIFPNPVFEHIDLFNFPSVQRAIIYDSSGTSIRTINQPQSKIDCSNLSSGFYFLTLISKDNQKISTKFIKK